MKLHIIGICGTFMGGVALLARALGHQVSGSDANAYPPMSTQLRSHGITLKEIYSVENIEPDVDCVIIGNALSRGNPEVECVLNRGLAYTSGAQWLADKVLCGRWVLAVAGTHGKTTTSSILSWLLEDAGLQPGFLIGGIAQNFGVSARLGAAPFFVVEADEYDTAFFDKRSKFVHYRPKTLILNNLEYDHADIFDDIEAIRWQFHCLLRTVPSEGRLIVNADDNNIQRVLARGCWSEQDAFSSYHNAKTNWYVKSVAAEEVSLMTPAGEMSATWSMLGRHNASNALAAIAAARHAGVGVEQAIDSLQRFKGVKRRLEVCGIVAGITIYDDFAHHPTAIKETISGLRDSIGEATIIALLELRSNSMQMGVHHIGLPAALSGADKAYIYHASAKRVNGDQLSSSAIYFVGDIEALIKSVLQDVQSGDHLLIMSNGSFEGIHQRILGKLADVWGVS